MATQIAAVRIVEDREVPPAGRWRIDPAHSQIECTVRHMMIAKVRGRFKAFDGELDIAVVPEQSRVIVNIDASSIDTGDEQRDAHLRSPDFLDVERFPVLRYRSTAVEPSAIDDGWAVEGELTIKDVTRPVTLHVDFNGAATDPWGHLRTAFSATAKIDREEFGLTWNQALESGGLLVGKTLTVDLDIEAVLDEE